MTENPGIARASIALRTAYHILCTATAALYRIILMLEIRITLLSIDLKHLRSGLARSLYEKLHIGKTPRLIADPPE